MTPSSTLSLPASRHKLSAAPLTYQQLDTLHCLRGFCALYVVVFHAKFILWAGGRQYLETHPRTTWGVVDYVAFAFDLLSGAGYEMVIFFFVLSGFFIRYAQHKKHRKAEDFYKNRLVRIYPPFLVSLFLAAITLTVIATQVPQVFNANVGRELNSTLVVAWHELKHFNAISALRAVTFLHLDQHYLGDNVVYWSLLPEALFYLLVPLALWRVRGYYLASAFLFMLGIYFDWRGIPLNSVLRYMFSYNAYFAVGIGLYDAVVCTNWLAQVRRISKWIALSTLLGMLLLLVTVSLLKINILPMLLAGVLAIMSISVLLAGFISPRNWIVQIMHKIGEFSFSLYLYHYPILLLLYAVLVRCTGKIFICQRIYWLAIPLVIAVCYGLYLITERKSVQYFRK